MAQPVMDAFVLNLKQLCPKFADYFEKNYAPPHVFKRWLRRVYMERYPADLDKLIPGGTQLGEGNFSSIKRYDLAQ